MEVIKKWIIDNHLDVEWVEDIIFRLDKKDYLVISPKKEKIFDENFELILDQKEADKILIDFYCFSFGGQVYYSSVKSDKVQLNLLKHIGKAKDIAGFPYLGVHGGYELCNGSRSYEDWCQKAKWLGIESLALAERHTLAGALKFQQAAYKQGIKPIIGETVLVKGESDYYVKLYVANKEGWGSLLRIHRNLMIDNLAAHVDESVMLENSAGLYCVFQNDTDLTKVQWELDKSLFIDIYYQFDPATYSAQNRDLQCLNCLKTYLDRYREIIPLALICDSYYLDQEDSRVKKLLSFIGKGGFQYQSIDQYFKSLEDVANQAIEMFTTKGEDFALDVLENAIAGAEVIASGCDFKINTKEIHLPKYILSKEEKKKFKNSDELFWHIIDQGLEKVTEQGKDVDKYLQRVEREIDIISRGGFVDYFLTLRDIINWSEANEIMVGTGRGSVAGSIVAYFCNLTKVDALEYDLIFERFLNESRIGKGLPDIDTDFESNRREDVKRYMEQRFGVHNVSSIGTYTTLKTKAAFRDLLRFHGEQPQNINYFAGFIEESNDDYSSLFHEGAKTTKLKEFINDHSESVSDVPLILGQPKSSSVHAAGVLIVPSEHEGKEMQIYDWFPCKIIDGVLVSEWEGVQLDEAGFLKADILGLTQLDKLHDMIKLIEVNHGVRLDLNCIDLKDQSVFELFGKGLNQDVFQFGTDGLSAYCRDVKPDSILELATITSLYRPGAMDSGAHIDYVKIKNGKKEPEYDFGTEEILKSTFGLYVFQEQAIFIVQKVGGFSLTDGDGVRKATGKKDLEKMKSYKDKFVAGAVANGCSEFEASKIWSKIEVFAGYSFNLSHAVAYSLIGYQTQWLKKHYPLEFWTTSLQHASDDEVAKRISEMNKFDGIKLQGPHINNSRSTFYTDWETNSIYWSLSRIAQVGEVSLNAIEKERNDNGKFFSLEEFVTRVKGKSVNSRVVKNLILSGCFDDLHNLEHPIQRIKLVNEFCKLYSIDTPEELKGQDVYSEFFWYKLQRNLSGYGYFDYSTVIDDKGFSHREYILPDAMQLSDNDGIFATVAGLIVEVVKRKTKKGEMGKITIDNNNDLTDVIIWNAEWEKWRSEIENNVGNAMIFNGKIQYDAYNKKNCIYSNENSRIEIF